MSIGTSAIGFRGSIQSNNVPEAFEAAISLGDFKALDSNTKLGDGSYFEWVNPSEIKAGETTCGFLTAPIKQPSYGDLTVYPTVDVYVCVKFAEIQPAPRGNIAVHCGGPCTTSDCIYLMGGEYSMGEAHSTYNVISFDQRGMGRSTPTFFVEECSFPEETDDFGDKVDVDVTEPDTIRDYARVWKKRNLDCWKSDEFQLVVTQNDGSERSWHFLEYSGTRQLAEDIERVRILFGDQQLSIYGISYGTNVFGTYATVFPRNINLMVLDGNQSPRSELFENYNDKALVMNNRIDYFIASCEFTEGGCKVDLRTCLTNLDGVLRENSEDVRETFKVTPHSVFNLALMSMFENYDYVPLVCNVAVKNYDILRSYLLKYQKDHQPQIALQSGKEYQVDSESKPTSTVVSPISGYAVRAQDYAFGLYSEDLFVQSLMELDTKYPGAGTHFPAQNVADEYGGAYFVPKTTPLPPQGNPELRGIVAGQLWDPATPYLWTLQKRENFPMTHLLTSRSVNHGLNDAKSNGASDPNCIRHYQHYFLTGEIDFVDGHVCEADDINASCTIIDIMTGGRCLGSLEGKNSPLPIE